MNITSLNYGEKYINQTSDLIKSINKGREPKLFYDENENRTRNKRLIPYYDSVVKNSYLYPNIHPSIKPYQEKLIVKNPVYDSIKERVKEANNSYYPRLKKYWY